MSTLALNRRNPSITMLTIDTPQQQQGPPPVSLRPVNTTSVPQQPQQIVTTPSITTSSGSLYHICRSVLDRLSTVEGMTNYLQDEPDDSNRDPLSKLTLLCRQGFPLCTLYNATKPAKLLSVESDPKLNVVNSCKANVYHFIVACGQNLLFPEEDMFTISDLYQDDTNGFVKVVNTINKLLQLLENRGIITVKKRSPNRNSDGKNNLNDFNSDILAAPKCTRDKVVCELLETERKYVQDMEILQNYMRELQIQKIVSPDTIHYLFGNLNSLVDFQRRFLIQLEEIAEKSPLEQRIGNLFISMEDQFAVYEPYCANYYSAQDLVVQETPRLQKLADILNPVYELPSMLIKPIQRICKYPLLLQELLKATDQNWIYYQETEISVQVIKRVTEKVNETQRQHENIQAVQELKKRLDDWKENLTIDGYGNLLLQDKLLITTLDNSNERDLHVFFFEKALLFCKEQKGNNLLQNNTLSINKRKTRRGSLVPKFILQTCLVTDLSNRCNKNGIWCLNIDLKQDELQKVTIKFRNEEQSKIWFNTLSKAIEKAKETQTKLMQHSLSLEQVDEEEKEEDDDDDSEVEFYDDDDDDDDDEYDEEEEMDNYSRTRSSGGGGGKNIFTTTKKKTTRSRSSSINNSNNTAMTAMSFLKSTSMKKEGGGGDKGRPFHNVPGMNLSPLPRSTTSSSTTASSQVSPQLPPFNTTNYSYYPASPPPSHPSSPTASSSRSTTLSSTRQQLGDIVNNFLSSGSNEQQHEEQHANYSPHSLLSTGRSQSQSAAINTNSQRPPLPIHQNRLRSQSSPNIMKNNASSATLMTPSESLLPPPPPPPAAPTLSPTMTTTTTRSKPTPLDLAKEQSPQLIRNVASTPRLTDIALLSQQQVTTPPSPGAIKIKLNFNDGIYVIVTNHEVTFFELMEKVDKKIRLVANLKGGDLLRLKYQDEDSDFITINSDDDVQMAFESRIHTGTVNLFVSL